MQSEVFKRNGPRIDLPSALLALGNAIMETDTSEDEFIFERIGEGTEAPLGNLIIGAYWAMHEWYTGQWSGEYAALCALGRIYRPGHAASQPEEDDSDFPAYVLCGRWLERHGKK